MTKTWSRFSKVKNGSEIKFRIEEVPIEKYEETFELFIEHFMPQESISVASGIPANPVALAEYKKNMMGSLLSEKHQIDACYVDDGSDKLAGASIMRLKGKSDPKLDPNKFKITTKEGEKYIKLVMALQSAYSVLDEQNLDCYFADRALVVNSEFRYIGIAGELFKAREEACREYKVPATAAWMTTFGTQKAAAKLGWETVKVLSYKDLEKEVGVSFPNGPTTVKLMFVRI